MEFVNRICPNCKNPNYMVLLGDFSKAYKYMCINCKRYFNDIDFEFENEEPELKKEYDNGYAKGFHDTKKLEEYLVELGVKIGFLTPEKGEQLLKQNPQIVRCEDCKWNSGTRHNPVCQRFSDVPHYPDWFCADGDRRNNDA